LQYVTFIAFLFTFPEILFVVVGNGYYLFSSPNLQCVTDETGYATVAELAVKVTTDDLKMENETFSLWYWW
jgi:hypothetical protein